MNEAAGIGAEANTAATGPVTLPPALSHPDMNRALLAAIPVGVVVHDADGRIVQANPQAPEILGLTMAQLIGREAVPTNWSLLDGAGLPLPDDRRPAIRCLKSGQALADVAIGVQLPDRSRRWLRVSSQPLYDRAGAIDGALVCLIDETHSRDREHWLDLAASAARIGLWSADPRSGWVQGDHRWHALLGLNEETSQNLSWRDTVHPDDLPGLIDSLDAFLRQPEGLFQGEFRVTAGPDEGWRWVLSCGAVTERDQLGVPQRMAGVLVDISQHREAELSLRRAATTDALTGLSNRDVLTRRLGKALQTARAKGRFGTLVLIDLDGFKRINDGFGHLAGDAVLRDVAQRLIEVVGPTETVARLGGDEMGILMPDCADSPVRAVRAGCALGWRVIDAIRRPFQVESRTFRLDASVGVTIFPEHEGESQDDLIREADTAMYEAKARGAGRVVAFHPSMYESVVARVELEQDLRVALERGEFSLAMQPKVDRSNRLCGAEALLRWWHPRRGLVMPNHFVSLAEETGLIVPIGAWALQETCRLLGGDPAHTMPIALNVSARQLKEEDFVDLVQMSLRQYGVNPQQLTLELTEGSMLDFTPAELARIRAIADLGVGLSLDDFGTGYSSLLHLKNLPFTEIKVDQEFVANAGRNRGDAAIVRAIAHIADEFGLTAVAEGVETPEQAEFMREAGCGVLQGYLFSRPMPATRFLERHQPGDRLWPIPPVSPAELPVEPVTL